MYIHGHFYNEQDERIEVHILTQGDRTTEVEIGADGSGLTWTDDPVDITSEVSDTFDVLLRQQASVRLLTKNFVPDFFCSSCRDAVVNIYREDKCLFAGFVEPQTYSQGYNEEQDEIELSCIDVLTAMQYAKYGNVGALGMLYGVVKSSANQRTMLDIIRDIMEDMTSGLDIKGGHSLRCLYDGSKAVDITKDNHYRIFSQLTISELLFLGDEEGDVWQQDEVLEEMLKYLNLHILQDGFTFYIFSWETEVRRGGEVVVWYDIIGNSSKTTECQLMNISSANVMDCNTTINIGEVYNQIQLTCRMKNVSNIVESPLDENLMNSPFSNKQKYMVEYYAYGNGTTARNAFRNMVLGNPGDYDAGHIVTWFVQVMRNKGWTLGVKGKDFSAQLTQNGFNQQELPNYLSAHSGAALLSLGNVNMRVNEEDDSPISKLDMTTYMVISVNGNGIDNDEERTYPSEKSLKESIPMAIYNGNTSGGVLSPSDDDTINYIVLSGDIILNPLQARSGYYEEIRQYFQEGGTTGIASALRPVPCREEGDGRFYTCQYFKARRPSEEAEYDKNTQEGFVPFTDKDRQEYEYRYSAIGEDHDTISKVGILQCMLIIGDKCVVETGTKGQTSDFEWRPYKTREQCNNEDEYYQQSFSIGFNPKIGDKLIGTVFRIQNNINYRMGIDAEGTAIPIHRKDRVSGRVQFMILGPVNIVWDDITRRHPTCFRHTKWSMTSVPLLAHVSSIMIKSFEMKIYSNNGLINNGNDDNDIIYMSDTGETFVNRKDDIEFRINSTLTSEERALLGVGCAISLSTPINASTGDAILSIYDNNKKVMAKPEQMYVDSYYNEYHKPRVLMTQTLLDKNSSSVNLFTHYRHPALGKEFYVQGISRNLTRGSAELTLKEIWI